jgi:hypothetical protein
MAHFALVTSARMAWLLLESYVLTHLTPLTSQRGNTPPEPLGPSNFPREFKSQTLLVLCLGLGTVHSSSIFFCSSFRSTTQLPVIMVINAAVMLL